MLLRLILKPVPRAPFKELVIPGKIEMEDFDVNGVGAGNTTYNDMDAENRGTSDYRKGTGVDIYEKDDGRIVIGYNQVGDWLEYTVNVAETGEYTMSASVASANETSSFKLAMDGKDITEKIAVPKGEGDDNYDDYKIVTAKVNLTKGEHIMRFIVTGDWMDIDYIEFKSGDENPSAIKLGAVNPVAAQQYNVFSATGKLMGRVDVVGRSLATSLKNAGFVNGIYVVRGVNSHKTMRVQVK